MSKKGCGGSLQPADPPLSLKPVPAQWSLLCHACFCFPIPAMLTLLFSPALPCGRWSHVCAVEWEQGKLHHVLHGVARNKKVTKEFYNTEEEEEEGTEESERQRCSHSALILTSYITCSMYQLHITQCVHWTWAESLHTCFSAQCLLWIQDIFSLVGWFISSWKHKAMTVITLKHLKQLYLLADLQLFDFSFMLYWLHTDLGDS